MFPESWGIISVEFAKFAFVDVSLVCLTEIVPPWVTSTDVDGLKRNLIKLSDTGSAVNPVGSSGSAVLPTAWKLTVEVFELRTHKELKDFKTSGLGSAQWPSLEPIPTEYLEEYLTENLHRAY